MLHDLEWQILERRQDARLIMLYKFTNGIVATDPKNLPITPSSRDIHSGHQYLVPSSCNDYHLFSYCPRTIRAWKKLTSQYNRSQHHQGLQGGNTFRLAWHTSRPLLMSKSFVYNSFCISCFYLINRSYSAHWKKNVANCAFAGISMVMIVMVTMVMVLNCHTFKIQWLPWLL